MIQLSGLPIFLHRKPKMFEFLTIFTFDDVMVLRRHKNLAIIFFSPDKFSTKTKKKSIQNVKNSSHKTVYNGGSTNVVRGRIRESHFNGSHAFITVGIEAK